MPAQHRHAPGFAAHAMGHEAGASGAAGFTRARFDAGQLAVPCAVHGARASPSGGGGKAPCHHDECPFCPCPCCCSQVHAAMGILPEETARLAHAPMLSAIAAPPALLGSRARFAVFAGQPRGPPILI